MAIPSHQGSDIAPVELGDKDLVQSSFTENFHVSVPLPLSSSPPPPPIVDRVPSTLVVLASDALIAAGLLTSGKHSRAISG